MKNGRGRRRVSSQQANAIGLLCKYGHRGFWQDTEKQGRKNVSRTCTECSRDKARYLMYGLSASDFRTFKQEHPFCDICGSDGTDVGRKVLEIDHDHATTKVRGMLCRTCNLFVGWYESHKHKIPKVERYLRASQT